MTAEEAKKKLMSEKIHDMNAAVELVRILRSEEGCPWDREQDHHSIRSAFIEETYEAVEAIDKEDSDLLKEELGDVLFQVLFHTELEREAGRFSLDDVTTGVVDKMIFRHPHVFGDVQVSDSGEVLKNWETLKKAEKSRNSRHAALAAVPKQYPSLLRAKKIAKKAKGLEIDMGDERTLCGELVRLAEQVGQTEGEARDTLLTRLIWQAVKTAGDDADLEKDLGDLLDGFVDSIRD